MVFNWIHSPKNKQILQILFVSSAKLSFSEKSNFSYLHMRSYVDVKMKWKKDSFYDSIDVINRSQEMKAIVNLKNCIIRESVGRIPVSYVSKRGYELDVPPKVTKVVSFLRQYPSIFKEFRGEHNHPWFELTEKAIDLDKEEQAVYKNQRQDLMDRLKKFILMSKEKKLPLKTIKGMQWYLGIPDDFLKYPEADLDDSFRFIDMGNDIQGLSVECAEIPLSNLQKYAVRDGESEQNLKNLAFPLFPSKGLRLKRKIEDWLNEFQKLPYVSPYEDSSHLRTDSDISEKRVIGVLHELLSLFVDNSVDRKKLLCLRNLFALPQKFYKAFDRHPHLFYLSLKSKICTPILKQAYNERGILERHPVLKIRKKYINLMNESKIILNERKKSSKIIDANSKGYVEA